MPGPHPGKTITSSNGRGISVRRFWLPQGQSPNLSDHGYLLCPDSRYLRADASAAFSIDALAEVPILCLLGEPGMGKTTTLGCEAQRLKSILNGRDRLLIVDLAACGSDVLVLQNLSGSDEFKSWKDSDDTLHLFLDGLDTCLRYIESLVALLLDFLGRQTVNRLKVRIACRTSEWPADLEDGLRKLWRGDDEVRIIELAPLRKEDVYQFAQAEAIDGTLFLNEVDRVGVSQLANRPITLQFLVDSFRVHGRFASEKTDLYREGCLVLADEWRHDLRRSRRNPLLSPGLRLSVACRLAYVIVFSRRAAVFDAPRRLLIPEGDARFDEVLGGDERYDGETVSEVSGPVIREVFETGLFRSVARYRFGFSHQAYADFLAARYIVERKLSSEQILKLILHPDGSKKVVPQLREVAAWLSAMRDDVCEALLLSDAASLIMSDTQPATGEFRRKLLLRTLTLYDAGELTSLRIRGEQIWNHHPDHFRYDGLADDLKPYIRNKSHNTATRLFAIMLARLTALTELQEDLVEVALNNDEILDIRIVAAVTGRMNGGERSRAELKTLIYVDPKLDPDDQLKGAGLAAAWPNHLSVDELLGALTLPKNERDWGIPTVPTQRIRHAHSGYRIACGPPVGAEHDFGNTATNCGLRGCGSRYRCSCLRKVRRCCGI